jgi:hypothetical protein
MRRAEPWLFDMCVAGLCHMSDAESRRGLEELRETGQLRYLSRDGVGCEFPSVALPNLGKLSRAERPKNETCPQTGQTGRNLGIAYNPLIDLCSYRYLKVRLPTTQQHRSVYIAHKQARRTPCKGSHPPFMYAARSFQLASNHLSQSDDDS